MATEIRLEDIERELGYRPSSQNIENVKQVIEANQNNQPISMTNQGELIPSRENSKDLTNLRNKQRNA